MTNDDKNIETQEQEVKEETAVETEVIEEEAAQEETPAATEDSEGVIQWDNKEKIAKY